MSTKKKIALKENFKEPFFSDDEMVVMNFLLLTFPPPTIELNAGIVWGYNRDKI